MVLETEQVRGQIPTEKELATRHVALWSFLSLSLCAYDSYVWKGGPRAEIFIASVPTSRESRDARRHLLVTRWGLSQDIHRLQRVILLRIHLFSAPHCQT